MRNILTIVLLLFIGQNLLHAQDRHKIDSLKGYEFINKEIKLLEKKGVKKTITFFDDAGKVIIVWKDENKLKYLIASYKGKDIGKCKTRKLSRKNEKNVNDIFQNPESLKSISKEFCNDKAHSFNKVFVSIKLNEKEYIGSFFTHCSQTNESLKSLLSLYFKLR